ncbi:TonB-dependent receptor domain-containing protein [Novosphingobium sp. BL-52-GroH]|uniref:TonB-dependent receptor domain-containing protein n=1 Tax=Novosphingobium sp. BL-52-GroH TaxID=3349877 RepID=UPI00384EBA54
MEFRNYAASIALAAATSLVLSAPATAQSVKVHLELPAQGLEMTLKAIARASGRQILIAADVVAGKTAPAIVGDFEPEEAVRMATEGSGVRFRFVSGTILIGSADPEHLDSPGNDITVTGSRIKGAAIASPRITVTREDIVNSGAPDLGAAMRALPQNFGGGQNPTLGLGAGNSGIANQNITGGSGVNLRGLGPDATLTLLNGNRLSYGGFVQAVDISGIPIDAIERVEIVPDGASAIYGSDAVAGVVNVVLRSDFDGLTISSRLGKATDGGNFSQLYSASGGTHWSSGSILATYRYNAFESIQARQRDYTAGLGDPYQLFPSQAVHSGLLRVIQDVGSSLRFNVDALYNRRAFDMNLTLFGVDMFNNSSSESFTVAPSFEAALGGGWTLTAKGSYSRDDTNFRSLEYVQGIQTYNVGTCYCNSLLGAEAFMEGPLANVPGGQIRLVAGAGHRVNRFRSENVDTGVARGGEQGDTFGYAELYVPLVSDINSRAALRALSLTLAGRYDRYTRFGAIATPKVGVIYAPSDILDLKYSWGRSFKAPTLMQQNSSRSVAVINTSMITGSSDPVGTTALYVYGGSPSLRAERATTMTWSAGIHPGDRLELDLSYFHIKYKGRVMEPIGTYRNAFNDIYSNFITTSPSVAQIQNEIASATRPLQSFSGASTDLSRIAYIIDNHYTNVAVQRVQGIDVGLSYRQPLGGGTVSTSLNASWLDTRQRNTATSDEFALAGTVWNPPRYRGRASLGWEGSRFRAFGYLNYTGSLRDNRFVEPPLIPSTVTADVVLSYSTVDEPGLLGGMTFGLSVDNAFNTKPPFIDGSGYLEPYDSTNYSPIGRFVAISASKSF